MQRKRYAGRADGVTYVFSVVYPINTYISSARKFNWNFKSETWNQLCTIFTQNCINQQHCCNKRTKKYSATGKTRTEKCGAHAHSRGAGEKHTRETEKRGAHGWWPRGERTGKKSGGPKGKKTNYTGAEHNSCSLGGSLQREGSSHHPGDDRARRGYAYYGLQRILCRMWVGWWAVFWKFFSRFQKLTVDAEANMWRIISGTW